MPHLVKRTCHSPSKWFREIPRVHFVKGVKVYQCGKCGKPYAHMRLKPTKKQMACATRIMDKVHSNHYKILT